MTDFFLTDKKCIFLFLGCFWTYLCWTDSQSYRLSHTNARGINQFYYSKDQSMKFSWKNIENWRSWKMIFFWVGHFQFFLQKNKKNFCFISMKTSSPFLWGIIYFCTMDGFFRILENISSKLICTRLYREEIHSFKLRILS